MIRPRVDSGQDAILVPEAGIPRKRRRVQMLGRSTQLVPEKLKDHMVGSDIVSVGQKRSLTSNDVPRKRFRGGQLSGFSKNWELAGASKSILHILSAGYTIPFVNQPPLVRFSDSLLKKFACTRKLYLCSSRES
nr:unnamed protein product [Callosobruchus analis]